MRKRDIIRRPGSGSTIDGGTDPSQDWRRFVLDQVGYDEVARDRIERRAMRRAAFRRFFGGMFFGLAVFALGFAVVFAVRSWRAGRLDRYLPQTNEAATVPLPLRLRERLPADAAKPDAHVNLPSPLYPTTHAPGGADDDGSAQPEATTAGNDQS
jgi:hypothetical protein